VYFACIRGYSCSVFKKRSTQLERIDTGDYTPAEYATFLREIRFINHYLGDERALRRSLLRDIEEKNLSEFSVLDVACGSGELLRRIASFARKSKRTAQVTGIDLNELSFSTIPEVEGEMFPEIAYVRGDAFHLPFADGSFDYAISSLFFHHLRDEQIPHVLREMTRVSRRGVFVIDLHRHPAAYYLYKLFCLAFRISPLVAQDGALSVLRGFRPDELRKLANKNVTRVTRVAPFRIVMRCSGVRDLRFDEHLEES
jgi:ubiquinone/menaquinone biosynthesis C-methylase UbiE